MKALLPNIINFVVMLLCPVFIFGQIPNLGSSANFSAFTAVGAFSNDGATFVKGDIGTNVGAFTGFPPGVVDGAIHVADPQSAQAAIDVDVAYSSMSGINCGIVLGTTIGNGQILTPNVYCLGAASTLTGALILDAQCDPDAIFIFKVNGAFSSGTSAQITLLNSASVCNIYWQINGAVTLGSNSFFAGNILANGAITLLEGAAVEGRVLSRGGAIALHNNNIDITTLPTASNIVANGPTSFCNGGSVILSGNCGGVWSNGSTAPTITVTSSGNYFVTNGNSCGSVTSNSVMINVNPGPNCMISGNSTLCQGQSTELCAPLGMSSYLWNNAQTNACITITTGGTYAVTITDANGCVSTCNKFVTLNPIPNCTISGNSTFCAGQSIQLCAPSGALSYSWSNGQSTNCITVNTAGTYFVTVTNTLGCVSICSKTVSVNPLPSCVISGNSSICPGGSTEICAPAGASAYLWSNGATTNCITVNQAGVYAVTVTSSTGCSSVCNKIIALNPSPICNITGNSAICAGQSTSICATPGAQSYLWNNGATTSCIVVTTAGLYTVTLTNAEGCTSTCSKLISLSPTPTCAITGEDFVCASGQTTEICAAIGAATYLWNTGASTRCVLVSAGTYTVTVTNADGCTSSCSKTIIIDSAPNCTITGNNTVCVGESTLLCVSVNAASYLWSTGSTSNCISVNTAGTYSVTVSYSNGCSSICSKTITLSPLPICTISGNGSICTGQTTQLCTPAGAASYLWNTGATTNCITVSTGGTYSVTVTNNNGCKSICTKDVAVNPLPICTILGDDFVCQQGQTTLLCVDNQTADYLWSTGATSRCILVTFGTYSVTVTNTDGCSSVCSKTIALNPQPVCMITGDNSICAPGQPLTMCVPAGASAYLWSSGQVTPCITVNSAGTYSVTVTYASGCTSVCSKTITINPVSSCLITGENLICAPGQTVQLCVPSGAASYLWNTGATTNCILVDKAGTYSITVTNSAGCVSICSKTVTAGQPQNCLIVGESTICNLTQKNLLCAPLGAFKYAWSTGDSTRCISVGLGNYTVTVYDANGCSSICSKRILLDSLPVCTIVGSNVLLPGSTTTICVKDSAASYFWSNGAITRCITVNTPGIYSVTVTNQQGCTSVCAIDVIRANNNPCIISGCTTICQGQTALLCAPFGYAKYIWNTGATTSCIFASQVGVYSVTVTDSSGVATNCWVNVTQAYIPPCLISGSTTIYPGQSTILCAPVGCTGYLWSTGATTSCIFVYSPGTYSLTLTNANGCVSICCVTVIQVSPPSCLISGCNTICPGQTTVLCAPAGAVSYLWSNGATTNCITVSNPGTYSLTVTNANCCISTCCYTVFQSFNSTCLITGPTTLVNGQPALLCVATGFQKYLWSNGDTTNCILAKNLGWYAVTVTSATGCISTCSIQITDGKPGNCINASTELLCQGQSALLCAPNASNTQYLWNTGSIQSCIAVNTKGIYTVTMTQNGVATVCQKTIVALQTPVCNITGNLSPEKGKSTQLCSATSIGKFLWNTGDTTSCITVVDSGSYSLTVTNANGCQSSCSVKVLYLLKAKTGDDLAANRSGQLQIVTYPNPFSDQATLEFQNSDSNSHVAIELCQLTGKKIATLFDQEIEQNKKYQVSVNAENLPEGIYLCRFVNGDQVITKKIVRIR